MHQEADDDAHFANLMESAVGEGRGIIVYFTAPWCGPCRMISPVFAQLAEQHSDKLFLKVLALTFHLNVYNPRESHNRALECLLCQGYGTEYLKYFSHTQVDLTNEEVQATVHKYGVTSIPYYLAYSGPEAVGQLVGADVEVRRRSVATIRLQENT